MLVVVRKKQWEDVGPAKGEVRRVCAIPEDPLLSFSTLLLLGDGRRSEKSQKENFLQYIQDYYVVNGLTSTATQQIIIVKACNIFCTGCKTLMRHYRKSFFPL